MTFQGAGGLGAVSIGVSDHTLEFLIIAIPMVILNLVMRGIARGAFLVLQVVFIIWTARCLPSRPTSTT